MLHKFEKLLPLFIRNKINTLNKNVLLKNMAILSGATAIAQAILLGLYPILTRIYTPEDFGVLSGYVAIISILIVIASLRYEVAIPLGKEDVDGFSLVILSVLFLLGTSITLSLVVYFLNDRIGYILESHSISFNLWLLPIGLFFMGIYQILTYWAIRNDSYVPLAKTKITQSVMGVSVQIALGTLDIKHIGLIIGEIIGRFSGSTRLIKDTMKKWEILFKEVSINRLMKVMLEYKKFPLLSTWSSLFNSATLNLPPLLIITFFGANIGGFFALCLKVISAPMLLVGKSVTQVYYGEASKLIQNSPRKLRRLFLEISIKLFLIGLVPVIILILFGPVLFKGVFGAEWEEAGVYIRILAGMLLLQFSVVPLSQTLYVLNKQQLMFYWDVIRFIVIIGSIILCAHNNFSALYLIITYSILMSMFYIVLFIIILLSLNSRGNQEI